jgi:hypothetical protein
LILPIDSGWQSILGKKNVEKYDICDDLGAAREKVEIGTKVGFFHKGDWHWGWT